MGECKHGMGIKCRLHAGDSCQVQLEEWVAQYEAGRRPASLAALLSMLKECFLTQTTQSDSQRSRDGHGSYKNLITSNSCQSRASGLISMRAISIKTDIGPSAATQTTFCTVLASSDTSEPSNCRHERRRLREKTDSKRPFFRCRCTSTARHFSLFDMAHS